MKYIEKRWVCNSKRCGKVWDFHGDFMVIFGIDGAGFMVIFGSFVNFFVNIEVLAGCFFFSQDPTGLGSIFIQQWHC